VSAVYGRDVDEVRIIDHDYFNEQGEREAAAIQAELYDAMDEGEVTVIY